MIYSSCKIFGFRLLDIKGCTGRGRQASASHLPGAFVSTFLPLPLDPCRSPPLLVTLSSLPPFLPAEIHLSTWRFPDFLLLAVMSPSSETPAALTGPSLPELLKVPHSISLFVHFSLALQAETVLWNLSGSHSTKHKTLFMILDEMVAWTASG